MLEKKKRKEKIRKTRDRQIKEEEKKGRLA